MYIVTRLYVMIKYEENETTAILEKKCVRTYQCNLKMGLKTWLS